MVKTSKANNYPETIKNTLPLYCASVVYSTIPTPHLRPTNGMLIAHRPLKLSGSQNRHR